MDRRYIFLMIAGFVVLTVVLIVIGLLSTPKPRPADEQDKDLGRYLSQKADIIDVEPLLTLPDLDQNNDVISFHVKQKDVIQNNRPLPLLPEDKQVFESGMEKDADSGVLRNLYKEKTRYYITNNYESTNRGTPYDDEGIRE